MTREQANQRMTELREQKIHCFPLDFKGVEPIPFLKIEVFEEEITERSFHISTNWKGEQEVVDWKKNYIFLLGELCGIESEPFKSEKLTKYSYLSKAAVFRTLPTGNRIYESAEYEFDAEVRAEETILKNELKYMEYQEKVKAGKTPKYEVKQKYGNDLKKKLAIVEQAKFARQRADSGAHKRAIMKVLKLPAPDLKFIGTHIFCYKCVPNFDSEAVRNKFLSGSPESEVFGAIESHVETIDNNDTIIRSKMEEYKDKPVLVKLSQVILDNNYEKSEYAKFLEGYSSLSKEDRVSQCFGWVSKFHFSEAKTIAEKGKSMQEWVNA